MLVLTRKRGEQIIVNNDITIEVVEIRGDKVRIGVKAPKEVSIHRLEIHRDIHGEPRGYDELEKERFMDL